MCGAGDGFDMMIVNSLSISSYAKRFVLTGREERKLSFSMAGVEFLLSCCPDVLSWYKATRRKSLPNYMELFAILYVGSRPVAGKDGLGERQQFCVFLHRSVMKIQSDEFTR